MRTDVWRTFFRENINTHIIHIKKKKIHKARIFYICSRALTSQCQKIAICCHSRRENIFQGPLKSSLQNDVWSLVNQSFGKRPNGNLITKPENTMNRVTMADGKTWHGDRSIIHRETFPECCKYCSKFNATARHLTWLKNMNKRTKITPVNAELSFALCQNHQRARIFVPRYLVFYL